MTLGTVGCQGPLGHGILQARILEWAAIPFSRGSPDPGMDPRSLALKADFLPSETPKKPLFDAQLLSCFADMKTHHQTEDVNYSINI